jgi:XisH protein
MGRKDAYRDAVKRALVRDGWRISHDPFPITYEGTRNEPDRMIFLAVREVVYNTFFQLPAIQAVIGDDEVRFIVFDITMNKSASQLESQ